jgi:hypothetical protein
MTDRALDVLDRVMLEFRAELDREIADSGAPARVRSRTLSRLADPMERMPWRRIAAAVLVAGMLGAALDLVLPERDAYPPEVAFIDPLAGLDEAGI